MLSLAKADTDDEALAAVLAGFAAFPAQSLVFVETRQSDLLVEPLERVGVLRRTADGQLIRETHSPRHETHLLTAHHLEIYHGGDLRQRFSLRHAPELVALRQALIALLDGDQQELETYFHSHCSMENQDWQLSLRPYAPAVAERVDSLHFTGRGTEVLSLQMRLSDGEVIDTRFSLQP
jgi:hypothetical protein